MNKQKIKIGRNFTNTFTIEALDSETQQKVFASNNLYTLNAYGMMKFKSNIEQMVELAVELGIEHLELDCDVPSPYLETNQKRRKQIRRLFEQNGITVSTHLPFTMSSCLNICSLQELERKIAVAISRAHLQFAADIGSECAVIHPGKIPFYFVAPEFAEKIHENIVKSLTYLAKYSSEHGVKLHLENNTVFNNIYVEVEDCIRAVKDVRDAGGEIYFNFDIGHWITRAKQNKILPDPVENILLQIPSDVVYEFHLNDYIIESDIFHPPLVEQLGELKIKNLENYAKLVRELGVKLIVVETALYNIDQIKNRYQIMRDEVKYLNKIFN